MRVPTFATLPTAAVCLALYLTSFSHASPPGAVEMVRAELLTGCSFLSDGTGILVSGKGDTNREIRLVTFAEREERKGETLWLNQRPFVTWGMNPVSFGTKMLFVRRGSTEGGLWVHDFTGGEPVCVRRDPFVGLPPATSADGSLILCYRWAGRSKRIGTVDPATGKFTSIPGNDMSQPALTGDGRRLLFIREGQVWLRELTDGKPDADVKLTALEVECGWPAWSPRGDLIAFTTMHAEKRGRVGLLRVGETHVRWLTEDLNEPRCPVFSPDGRQVAFIARTDERPPDDVLWVMEVD
ncbi:MAG: PD40 domain-containing protein [Armatimonadetes bacterium]|nr:PD40 domain-containing protein [Armatimonadota bacterium]